jgi:isopentenyl-diphosphate Delta-isomerase
MVKVAMLWLANERGDLLLARRAAHKKQDPGLWGPSVTGKVELGETFEEALSREADEELALKADAYTFKFLFETDFLHPDGETRQFKVYLANVPSAIIKRLAVDANEVAEIRWMSIPDIKELLNSKPGELVVASAFGLWNQIFEALENKKDAGANVY